MISYLKKAKVVLEPFKYYMIRQISRDSNSILDALAKIASLLDFDAPDSIRIKYIKASNISSPDQIIAANESISWMTPIVQYLRAGVLHNNKTEDKLDATNGNWADDLLEVPWASGMTPITSTSETPFSLAYGYEAMALVEVGAGYLQREFFSEIDNEALRLASLDLVDKTM
ncbi:uncharacterized protein LOC116133684 [Pistacia vera]|uniref:uncharacterized protein LOC116133684 n=1 Tax=Pistacia vera TaxID=55513 RepID=UPI00126362C8|nr:uncharacterized protein LOC116133684 [Pistacia vera]